MSVMYHNIMEDIVEDRLTEIFPTLDCCTCDICRNDIIAYALNRLPAKYVVGRTGEVFSKLFILRQQHDADIIAALTRGANLTKQNPHHST